MDSISKCVLESFYVSQVLDFICFFFVSIGLSVWYFLVRKWQWNIMQYELSASNAWFFVFIYDALVVSGNSSVFDNFGGS